MQHILWLLQNSTCLPVSFNKAIALSHVFLHLLVLCHITFPSTFQIAVALPIHSRHLANHHAAPLSLPGVI